MLRTLLKSAVRAFAPRRAVPLPARCAAHSTVAPAPPSEPHAALSATPASPQPTGAPPAIPGTTRGGDQMVMMYTCGVCNTRSARTMSKAAYHTGVVLVRCSGCSSLHLVADHLGYFEDNDGGVQAPPGAYMHGGGGPGTTVETMLAARGEAVRRGVFPRAGGVVEGGVLSERGEGGLEDVVELTADDVAVLRSVTKSVQLEPAPPRKPE